MAKKQTEVIELPRPQIKTMVVTIVGDSPLICHAWSHKAKQEMLDKQMKKAKAAKTAKDPHRDYCESLYWLSKDGSLLRAGDDTDAHDGGFGFPAVAFKATAVSACRNVDGIPMTLARGAFHVDSEYVVIKGDKPQIREDMVRIGMGTADIRYRGEFRKWSVELTVRYNKNVLSAEQILNLFNTAGFACGVGEWRPSSKAGGSFGMFHVA